MSSFAEALKASEPISFGKNEDFAPSSYNSNLSSSLPNFNSVLSSSVPVNGGDQNYRNVKMKYFRSLGVNQPGGGGGQPTPDMMGGGIRSRSNTDIGDVPHGHQSEVNIPSSLVEPGTAIPAKQRPIRDSPRKKRSVSTPIPIQPGTGALAIPNPAARRSVEEEEEEEEEYEEEEDELFIPPHEMMARQFGQGFAVGTAHSLAVWEQQKRRNISNNV